MLKRSWPSNHRGDKRVIEAPQNRKLRWRHATLFGALNELSRDFKRLRSPFRFHHARIVTAGTCRGIGCRNANVFTCEDAAGQGRIIGHTEPEVPTGGHDLDLGSAANSVVVRLANDGRLNACLNTKMDDLCYPPGRKVGHTNVVNFAGGDNVRQCVDCFVERRVVVVDMQIHDINVVGREPRKAVVNGLKHRLAAAPALIRATPKRVGKFARQDPFVSVFRDQCAGNPL